MENHLQQKFDSYPPHIRPYMERLRQLILDVASQLNDVGKIEQTLKWGEPSFLTSHSKTGATIRIDWKAKFPDRYALYVNCKTTLIDTYKTLFPELTYEGNRAILFDINQNLPEKELRICIAMALRYHIETKPILNAGLKN